ANLTAPREIGSGNGFSCAIHQPAEGSKVACWGDSIGLDPLQVPVPDVVQSAADPVGLTVNGDLACLTAPSANGSQVLCWFVKENTLLPEQTELAGSSLVGAYGITFGGSEFGALICGVANGNIQCAGSNDAGPAMVPSVLAPASLAAGDNHV